MNACVYIELYLELDVTLVGTMCMCTRYGQDFYTHRTRQWPKITMML